MQNWTTKKISTEREVFEELVRLQGRRWLSRGQHRPFGGLLPSIDRNGRKKLSRQQKLTLERQSINLFQRTARYLLPGEESAANDDVSALMVMQQYHVPTRLLDWSISPYIALYFAVDENDKEDGELWCFDELRYEKKGAEQWEKWPKTTVGGKGPPAHFDAKLTMFKDNPPPWFVCQFYPRGQGFPRQNAQQGAYSLTSDFGRDHAEAIGKLLKNHKHCFKYEISKSLKPQLRKVLLEKHNICRGSLFSDTAGAAETAKKMIEGRACLALTGQL